MSADMTVAALVALGRDVVAVGMKPSVTARLHVARLSARERWLILRAMEWMALADEDATGDGALRGALDAEYSAIITASSASRDVLSLLRDAAERAAA